MMFVVTLLSKIMSSKRHTSDDQILDTESIGGFDCRLISRSYDRLTGGELSLNSETVGAASNAARIRETRAPLINGETRHEAGP